MTVVPYGESLGSLLYPGAQNGLNCLQPMVLMTERVLPLTPAQRRRTLWRLDGGFGTDAAINWLLPRDYQLLVKGYNNLRAQKVVRQVPESVWQEVGPAKWAASVPNPVRYARRTQTLALHWLTEHGHDKCALLIHQLFDQAPAAIVARYNARGGMETEIREDKVGLQLVKRRKHAWNAQAAWVILGDMAHNLLTWTHDWMWYGSSFETYGMLRIVSDLLNLPGRLEFGGRKDDKLVKVALQRSHPYAREMQACLTRLFKELHV